VTTKWTGLLLPAAPIGRILGCGAVDGKLDGDGAAKWRDGGWQGVAGWHSATVFSLPLQFVNYFLNKSKSIPSLFQVYSKSSPSPYFGSTFLKGGLG
jgi:hypothetical protein